MAEHPIIMDSKNKIRVLVKTPEQAGIQPKHESVVESAPDVSEPKKSIGQRFSKYAFGEEVASPGQYVWKSYLEPTGKRVANDIVEHFLMMLKHSFQRWIWNGKTLDDGKFGDRTSFSNYGKKNEPIKAMVLTSPVKELTFATRADAENVLRALRATMEEEGGMVTVRTYYELGGRQELCGDGTASSSGWTNLSKVEVKDHPDGSGFYLTLPRPMNLSQQ